PGAVEIARRDLGAELADLGADGFQLVPRPQAGVEQPGHRGDDGERQHPAADQDAAAPAPAQVLRPAAPLTAKPRLAVRRLRLRLRTGPGRSTGGPLPSRP